MHMVKLLAEHATSRVCTCVYSRDTLGSSRLSLLVLGSGHSHCAVFIGDPMGLPVVLSLVV